MKKVVALAVLAVAAAPVFAGDFYVVGSIGQSTFDVDKGDIDDALVSFGATGLSSKMDKSDTGYKLQLGYQFNPYFALEGGYINLGEAKYKATFNGISAKASVESAGWNLSALGIYPIGDAVTVFGKLGAIAATTKLKASASAGGFTASDSEDSTNWEVLAGLGASYNFTKQLAVRVEYERFFDVGDKKKTGEGDISLLSAGVVFKF